MAAKLHKVPPVAGPVDWDVLKAQAAARRRLEDFTGLEGRYLDLTLADYKASTQRQREALRACSAYAQGFDWSGHGGAGLWLLGPCGTGKSHLAAGIVRALYEAGEEATFTTPRALIRRFRESWVKPKDADEDWVSESGLLDIYGRYINLLVLDDVGAWAGTDAELLQLGDVIDLRSTHRRPTVITSNLTSEQLRETLGDRSFDRLAEGARVLVVDGPSYRTTPKAAA